MHAQAEYKDHAMDKDYDEDNTDRAIQRYDNINDPMDALQRIVKDESTCGSASKIICAFAHQLV